MILISLISLQLIGVISILMSVLKIKISFIFKVSVYRFDKKFESAINWSLINKFPLNVNIFLEVIRASPQISNSYTNNKQTSDLK